MPSAKKKPGAKTKAVSQAQIKHAVEDQQEVRAVPLRAAGESRYSGTNIAPPMVRPCH